LELAPHVEPATEVVVAIETGDDAVYAILRHDAFEIRRGTATDADVTLSGPAQLVGAVLSGLLTLPQATKRGLRISGTPSVLGNLVRVAARHSSAGQPA
jgi:hypothetical protein